MDLFSPQTKSRRLKLLFAFQRREAEERLSNSSEFTQLGADRVGI